MRFKLLKEAVETYAIMLRRDGKVFNVSFHPYGTDGPEYTLEFCEWLYNATLNNSTKNLILEFIVTYCSYAEVSFDELSAEVETKELLNDIRNYVIRSPQPLDKLDAEINAAMNQEFCRVRFGGRYDSDDIKGGEIVFRISSSNFNWFNIIWNYVYQNRNKIQYVTIVRDLESTGDNKYYSHNNHVYNRMPINDFIVEEGNPVVEEKNNG